MSLAFANKLHIHQALEELAQQCTLIAKEILQNLGNLNPSGKGNLFRSIRQGVDVFWS